MFDAKVRTFKFINVKSINRNSAGHHHQMAVAVALPGGRIQMVDIYGNHLIEFQTENDEEVIQIRSHPSTSNDDCYVAALTDQGTFYVFNFELKRLQNWKEMEMANKRKEKGLGPIFNTQEVTAGNETTNQTIDV